MFEYTILKADICRGGSQEAKGGAPEEGVQVLVDLELPREHDLVSWVYPLSHWTPRVARHTAAHSHNARVSPRVRPFMELLLPFPEALEPCARQDGSPVHL